MNLEMYAKNLDSYTVNAEHQSLREASVVILVRRTGDELYVFQGLRCDQTGVPRIVFPGGKVEPGESYKVAAAREAREEIGILEIELKQLFEAFRAQKTATIGGMARDHEPFRVHVSVVNYPWTGVTEPKPALDEHGVQELHSAEWKPAHEVVRGLEKELQQLLTGIKNETNEGIVEEMQYIFRAQYATYIAFIATLLTIGDKGQFFSPLLKLPLDEKIVPNKFSDVELMNPSKFWVVVLQYFQSHRQAEIHNSLNPHLAKAA